MKNQSSRLKQLLVLVSSKLETTRYVKGWKVFLQRKYSVYGNKMLSHHIMVPVS